MKTNGATWKAYLASWPDGQWYDDHDESINGETFDGDPEDDAVVEVTCGVVYADENDREGKDLIRHFRAWERAQSHANVLCNVPKDKLEDLSALLKGIGGKVLKG